MMQMTSHFLTEVIHRIRDQRADLGITQLADLYDPVHDAPVCTHCPFAPTKKWDVLLDALLQDPSLSRTSQTTDLHDFFILLYQLSRTPILNPGVTLFASGVDRHIYHHTPSVVPIVIAAVTSATQDTVSPWILMRCRATLLAQVESGDRSACKSTLELIRGVWSSFDSSILFDLLYALQLYESIDQNEQVLVDNDFVIAINGDSNLQRISREKLSMTTMHWLSGPHFIQFVSDSFQSDWLENILRNSIAFIMQRDQIRQTDATRSWMTTAPHPFPAAVLEYIRVRLPPLLKRKRLHLAWLSQKQILLTIFCLRICPTDTMWYSTDEPVMECLYFSSTPFCRSQILCKHNNAKKSHLVFINFYRGYVLLMWGPST